MRHVRVCVEFLFIHVSSSGPRGHTRTRTRTHDRSRTEPPRDGGATAGRGPLDRRFQRPAMRLAAAQRAQHRPPPRQAHTPHTWRRIHLSRVRARSALASPCASQGESGRVRGLEGRQGARLDPQGRPPAAYASVEGPRARTAACGHEVDRISRARRRRRAPRSGRLRRRRWCSGRRSGCSQRAAAPPTSSASSCRARCARERGRRGGGRAETADT